MRFYIFALGMVLIACGDTGGGATPAGPNTSDAAVLTDCMVDGTCHADQGMSSPLDASMQLDAGQSDFGVDDAKVDPTPDSAVLVDAGHDDDAELDSSMSPFDSAVNTDQDLLPASDAFTPDDGVEPPLVDAEVAPDQMIRPLPDACYNGVLDPGESEVDCDGHCAPCMVFVDCETSSECGEQTCYEGRCIPSHCDDGIQNHGESEIDCGGGCGQCVTEGCLSDIDCALGVCELGRCVTPTCGNGIVDEGEECDDGNLYRFDGCLPDCVVASNQLCVEECSNQGTRLTPAGEHLGRVLRSTGSGGDGFGLSLANSNDQVFVGAPFGAVTGTVSVFKKSGEALVPVEELVPRDVAVPELFGATLAADRDTLLVGAPGAQTGGVVYVFRRRGGESWVHYKLDGGIEHILLDESQDTSPEQWRVIASLANDFFSGEGAGEKDRSVPRTIFAVGDQKQSIFSFQGADPKYFSKMRSFFEKKVKGAKRPWSEVELAVSFRSVRRVLQVVDKVFDQPGIKQGVLSWHEKISHMHL